MNKLSNIWKSAKVIGNKHAPEILIGCGVAGLISSAVMMGPAAIKASKMLKSKKEKVKRELTKKEIVKTTWKPYVAPTITAVSSVACIIGGTKINLRRNAALITAYNLSKTAFTEYKEEVKTAIGEKKEQKIQESIDRRHVTQNPPKSEGVIVTKHGDTLCYDNQTGRYFKSDIDKIKKAVNDLNARLLREMSISLNEFYYAISLPCVAAGSTLGWTTEKGLIDVTFSAQIAGEDSDFDGTPCVVVNLLNLDTVY